MSVLKKQFAKSTQLSDWMQSVLSENGNIAMSRRPAVALALCSLALDHREAFLLLVHRGARPTAMAVIRPVLEAYIRALWANELATDAQLSNFLQGRYDPAIESTLQKLRKAAEPHGAVFETLRRHYQTLNDYTHGGARQVSRWIRPGEVAPQYSDDQIAEALHFVDVIGLMAAISREKLLDKPSELLLNRLQEMLKQKGSDESAS